MAMGNVRPNWYRSGNGKGSACGELSPGSQDLSISLQSVGWQETSGGFHSHRGTPKWLVCFMENPMNEDDGKERRKNREPP